MERNERARKIFALVAVAAAVSALVAWKSAVPFGENLSEGASGLEQEDELGDLRARLRELEARLDDSGESALAEAQRLGIEQAVAEFRPRLRESAVRRMSVALVTEARRNGLDPLLLTALARVESGFDPYAVSSAGALGLLQIRPGTGRALLEEGGERMFSEAELYDIETNVALGARYLTYLLGRFGSLDLALLAYNRGPDGARAALRGPSGRAVLQGYPRTVLGERTRLSQRLAERLAKRDTADG